ncbi:YkvI family membrane protein [Kineobactrum salinum]|uniref:GerAB/ArcD/ProY family transporter n=1 Tax=Kineobactrum salinum TaxID=2708301 RepID=A0A6C0U570_9GAMM|nr:hypothetical protein [Kineobactrum salinum]QIB64594.1 hypothetical protein G3T16_03465 [Kineobactrum salinum]
MRSWRAYILPGLIFQSVIIGGGYATGRELVEFFIPSGPVGGLLGILVAGAAFSIVMSAAYEFARVTRSFDYRSFCKHLLGPAWILYEVAYVALVILILAVVGSAAGELVLTLLGVPATVGTVVMMVLVGLLTFLGSAVIQRALAFWSVLLYLVYLALFIITFIDYGDAIQTTLAADAGGDSWLLNGVRYAGYNINLPAVLFCMALLTSRRQAVGAGMITGAIAVIPAFMFYLAMMSQYPQIAEQPVPALYLMAQLDTPWLQLLFQLVVFGTFVETGTGLLHSINERIDVQARESGHTLPRLARPLIAGGLLLVSVYGATEIGIVDLIAHGYGFLTYVFIAVLIVPLLTMGLWKIHRLSLQGN